MDAELFSAENLKKQTDLIGKNLYLGTRIFNKTDSTDSSVGRAEDCSVRSKFDSNP